MSPYKANNVSYEDSEPTYTINNSIFRSELTDTLINSNYTSDSVSNTGSLNSTNDLDSIHLDLFERLDFVLFIYKGELWFISTSILNSMSLRLLLFNKT